MYTKINIIKICPLTLLVFWVLSFGTIESSDHFRNNDGPRRPNNIAIEWIIVEIIIRVRQNLRATLNIEHFFWPCV